MGRSTEQWTCSKKKASSRRCQAAGSSSCRQRSGPNHDGRIAEQCGCYRIRVRPHLHDRARRSCRGPGWYRAGRWSRCRPRSSCPLAAPGTGSTSLTGHDLLDVRAEQYAKTSGHFPSSSPTLMGRKSRHALEMPTMFSARRRCSSSPSCGIRYITSRLCRRVGQLLALGQPLGQPLVLANLQPRGTTPAATAGCGGRSPFAVQAALTRSSCRRSVRARRASGPPRTEGQTSRGGTLCRRLGLPAAGTAAAVHMRHMDYHVPIPGA